VDDDVNDVENLRKTMTAIQQQQFENGNWITTIGWQCWDDNGRPAASRKLAIQGNNQPLPTVMEGGDKRD
jgi:hypothetical protein